MAIPWCHNTRNCCLGDSVMWLQWRWLPGILWRETGWWPVSGNASSQWGRAHSHFPVPGSINLLLLCQSIRLSVSQPLWIPRMGYIHTGRFCFSFKGGAYCKAGVIWVPDPYWEKKGMPWTPYWQTWLLQAVDLGERQSCKSTVHREDHLDLSST